MAKDYVLFINTRLGTKVFKKEVALVSGHKPAKSAPKSSFIVGKKVWLSLMILDVQHTPLGAGLVKIGGKLSMLYSWHNSFSVDSQSML